ncbi:MAG: deoxyhypusine synthase family protein [Candidatus Bathyarchaeota archaeon]|nr:deoxyhypusine synthase family protein [Candidatus Bathyarchaeota archaeon]
MEREELFKSPVVHMKLKNQMTVNQLIKEFDNSGSFGAGRVATACDIYERMIRDEECTIFLSVAGAIVPAGLRSVIAGLIRKKYVDAVVTTGANMVHDLLEATGGHHYKGHWNTDDTLLYKYHTYRIYDMYVPEEDFVKEDYKLALMFDEIAKEHKGGTVSSDELMVEIGKRLSDSNSILRAAYEAKVPVFVPAIRDSEFCYIYWLHASRKPADTLLLDAFKDTQGIIGMASKSPRLGMIVLGGGVPRNTVQHSAAIARKGMDYAILITMDRPETGGLSGSTLREAMSWGKVKPRADHITVVGDVMIVFPLIVASVLERLGSSHSRRRG